MRAAKRRSNPDGEGIHTGLLRFAHNDGERRRCAARNGPVIASREAAKQSSRGAFSLDCFASLAMTGARSQ
ncbi:MAG: hypothetical protein LBT00_03050 [Spirochaetaceae bacterium]|nr:hypothetical protein [Spirochaetaceae bacterium]